jgi:hypothetical protein
MSPGPVGILTGEAAADKSDVACAVRYSTRGSRREFVGAAAPHAPEIDERILRDDGVFVTAETTLVPSAVAAGESARAHVRFVRGVAMIRREPGSAPGRRPS